MSKRKTTVSKSRPEASKSEAVPSGDPRAPRVPAWFGALLLATPLVIVLGYGLSTVPPSKPLFAWPGSSGSAPVAAPATPPGHPPIGPTSGARAPAAGADASLPPDIEPMVERLAKRLESQPDDAKGWRTLAHSYYVLKRFPDAVKAYESLLKVAPPDAALLADYADAAAMAQGRRLDGKPMELVRRALELDPTNWKAQSMAATDAFNRKDYDAAIGHWQRALASAPPGSELAQSLEANIAEARALTSSK